MDVALVVAAGLIVLVAIMQGIAWLLDRRRPKTALVSAEQARADVLAVAAGGSDRDQIRAIKVLRERTGLGLLEAKRTVDRWLEETGRTSETRHDD